MGLGELYLDKYNRVMVSGNCKYCMRNKSYIMDRDFHRKNGIVCPECIDAFDNIPGLEFKNPEIISRFDLIEIDDE